MVEISFGVEYESGIRDLRTRDMTSRGHMDLDAFVHSLRNGWLYSGDGTCGIEIDSPVFTNGRDDWLHTFIERCKTEYYGAMARYHVEPVHAGDGSSSGQGNHTHIGKPNGITETFAAKLVSFVRPIYPFMLGICANSTRALNSRFCMPSDRLTQTHANESDYSHHHTLELRAFDSAHPIVHAAMLGMLIPYCERVYANIERDDRDSTLSPNMLKIIKIEHDAMRTIFVRGQQTKEHMQTYIARYLFLLGRDLCLANYPISVRRVLHMYFTGFNMTHNAPTTYNIGYAAKRGIDWEGNINGLTMPNDRDLKAWLSDYLIDDTPTLEGIKAACYWSRGSAGKDCILGHYGTRMFNALDRIVKANGGEALADNIGNNRKYRIFAMMVREDLNREMARLEAEREHAKEVERMRAALVDWANTVERDGLTPENTYIGRISETRDAETTINGIMGLLPNANLSREYITAANERYYTAWSNNADAHSMNMLGVCAVRVSTGYIGHLAVNEAVRRKGIAKRLISTCLRVVHNRAVPYAIIDTTNAHSRALFAAMGFTEIAYPVENINRVIAYKPTEYTPRIGRRDETNRNYMSLAGHVPTDIIERAIASNQERLDRANRELVRLGERITTMGAMRNRNNQREIVSACSANIEMLTALLEGAPNVLSTPRDMARNELKGITNQIKHWVQVKNNESGESERAASIELARWCVLAANIERVIDTLPNDVQTPLPMLRVPNPLMDDNLSTIGKLEAIRRITNAVESVYHATRDMRERTAILAIHSQLCAIADTLRAELGSNREDDDDEREGDDESQ